MLNKKFYRLTISIILVAMLFITGTALNGINAYAESISVENNTENTVEDTKIPETAEYQEEQVSAESPIVSEIASKRDESVKHYALADGSFIAVQYGKTIHYKNNGTWEDINNRLDYEASKDENDINGYTNIEIGRAHV
jgi:hypothetical protein